MFNKHLEDPYGNLSMTSYLILKNDHSVFRCDHVIVVMFFKRTFNF